MDLYAASDVASKYRLAHGTLVRHYNYKLTNLANTLSPSPGNLYHYLHATMFDPLFPFRIVDIRSAGSPKDERVNGSRNRLMRLVQKGEDDSDGRIEMRHYCPMEYVVPVGSDNPCIGIEYWVILATRKGKGKQKEEVVLRSQSNELFVQAGHPIIATMNGQNQGELTSKLIRDLNLSMLSRHMVIHIDATNADSRIRRELFATNREGMKDGPVLEGLLQVLRNMLTEDDVLAKIEQELAARLSQRETQATDEEVKREVSRLLREAGYRVTDTGPSTATGSQGQEGDVSKPGRRRPKVADPLPTLAYPEVTRFELVFPKPTMRVPLNDNEVVLVETDADARFDKEGRVAIRFEPDSLELASVSPLRGGRMRWRVRPKSGTVIGEQGLIIVTLTRPDGTQLADRTGFEILPPKIEPLQKSRGDVPPFHIVPIDPTGHEEQWGIVWETLAEEDDPGKLASVAYKPIKQSGGIYVYYSTIFQPFAAESERLRTNHPSLVDLFRRNYEIWIAYHAILQIEATTEPASSDTLTDDAFERLREDERTRVATTQVKQALRMAEIMQEAITLRAVGDD